MALKNDIIDKRFGMTVSDAYIKLGQVFWSDKTGTLVASFMVFSSPTAQAEEKDVIDIIDLDISEMFTNIEARVYAKLKTEPDFLNAVDV